MDEGQIAILKMAGYSVERAYATRYEWYLHFSDDGYEDESEFYTDTEAESWADAWKHFLNRTKENV